MVATAAESPTPLPRVHELDYRSGLGADRYGFGIAGDTGIDPYRRSRSRQSTSSRPSYSGSTSGLRRSLSSNKLSPNGNTSAASGLNGSSSAFARPHSSAAFTKPSSRNVSGNEASKFRYAKEDESSDDDVPAPIKFSASVRALLEEDGGPGVSELKSSPRSQSRSPVVRSSRPSVEGGDQMHEPLYQSSNRSKYQVDSQAMATASKPARQVRIASPRRLSSPRTSSQHVHGDMKNTPSPSSSPRLVKVTGRSPSALSYFRRSPSQPTSDRSVRTQRTGSDASEASNVKDHHTGKEENNHENFVTPAPGPRKRAVRVSGSRRDSPTAEQDGFPATGGQHSNYYRHFEQPTRDEHMMEESYLNNKHDERDFEGSIRPTPVMRPWAGMNSIHAGDEAGIASTRVKRVGKLTGSFLKGPARRGVLRRQSEEERQLERERQIEEHDSEGERERDVQLDPVTPSPEARDPARVRHGISSQPEPQQEEEATPHGRSPSPAPLSRTPPQANNEKKEIKVVYDVPAFARRASSAAAAAAAAAEAAPVSSIPHRGHDENDDPEGIRRKLERPSKYPVIHEDEGKQKQADTPQRQPLAARSGNAPTPMRAAPPPPQKPSAMESAAAPAAQNQMRKKRVQVTVNRKPFTRLDCIGRGGSGRVYRVMAENCKIFALKRVNLADVDPIALQGYKGEISLLKKLSDVERVVRLYDFELNEEKQTLSVLMEFGESDLHNILAARLNAEDAVFDPSFTRFYWKEMLECVQSVHALNIVHSDLKPANFVLVRGKLKLIDFGIADAIQDNTVNVHRETQIGTPNYMAPEALIDTNAGMNQGKMMKLGKPSDVWSLGCILYQMVYGRQPFAHIPNQLQRVMAITNPSVAINFPERTSIGDVKVPEGLLRILKACLNRDQRKRPSIADLLSDFDPFLHPEILIEEANMKYPDGAVPMTQEMLARILNNVVNHCRARGLPKDEEVRGWPAGFMKKIRGAMEAAPKR